MQQGERPGDGSFTPEVARSEISVYGCFWHAAQHYEEKAAIDDGSILTTYSQLLDAISRIGGAIAGNVRESGPIGLVLKPTACFPPALLACLAFDRDVIILDPDSPKEHIAQIVHDAGIVALFIDATKTTEPHLPQLQVRRGTEWIVTEPGSARGGHPRLMPKACTGGSLIILYTSGSTGKPKGIVSSQFSVLERCWQHVGACAAGDKDVFMPLSPPGTIAGLREALSALLCGATLRMIDQKRVGLRETARVMREAGVTICYAVPTLLRALLKMDNDYGYLSTLRVLRVGGERVLWDDVEMLRQALPSTCAINVSYSSTETIGASWFLPRELRPDELPVPVGYIGPHATFRIVDQDGNPVPVGAVGELVVRGRHVASGYWEQGGCIPGGLREHPEDPTQRVFHTGDLVSMDASGLLRVFGRLDRQVKIRGQRVEPAELEATLRSSPDVIDAVVVVREAGEDAALVAFVVSDNKDQVGLEFRLRSVVRHSLRQALHPAALYVLDSFPTLLGGKVDRRALLEIDRGRYQAELASEANEGVGLAPTEPTLRLVSRLWDSILDNRSSTLDRTWNDAGGDSLKFLRLFFELEETLGRSLLPGPFTVDMRPREIASALDSEGAASGAGAMLETHTRLFLFPGVSGDEPRLSAMREELRGQLLIATIRYPGWDVISDPSFRFADMISELAAQISEAAPAGGLLLAGYSYGGIVAFAVARHLSSSGRAIAFLGLLDTEISSSEPSRSHEVSSTFAGGYNKLPKWIFRPGWHDNICRVMAKYLSLPKARWISLRLLGPKSSWLSSRTRFALDYWACRLRRMSSALSWPNSQIGPAMDIPTFLFRSQRCGPNASSQFGWQTLLTDPKAIAVTGDHFTMLDPPHLSGLTDKLLHCIQSCLITEAEPACIVEIADPYLVGRDRDHVGDRHAA
jgi:acyl-coenzyme A synthetase/AMP-(fatty) acid ligase/thioesterase domain-containing protein